MKCHEAVKWTIAEGRTDKYVYTLRFCRIPADFPRAHYPARLNVFWKLPEPLSNGMPSPADVQRMAAFEELIVAATEANDVAVLPLVLTGRGEREYVFFVKSPEAFLQCLNDMPQEDERYPIEIRRQDDPTWAYYDHEMASLTS